MADEKNEREADRFAAGSGGANMTDEDIDPRDMMPGVESRGANYLHGSEGAGDSAASRAEGTVGAAGEMDFTGSPAGTVGAGGASGGSAAAESRGGGPGGGSMSSGGAGTRAAGAGAQSAESTLAALGDRELSTGTGGGGASGTGGEGGSDAAGDSARTGAPDKR